MRFIHMLIILIIISTGISPVFAVEWVDPQENTLRLMESFTREGLSIEASDFYDNSVVITVYDADHQSILRNIVRNNDSFDINDQLNIAIMNIQEAKGNTDSTQGLNAVVDQWVKIQTMVAGRPAPKLSIIPSGKQIDNKTIINRVFTPGSEISINFSIRNEGKAALKSPILKINSTLPLLSDDALNYELPDIESGSESDTITVRFKAPFAGENKQYTITAEAEGYDDFGKAYNVVDSTYIEVRPQIGVELKKYVTEKTYIGDVAVVSVSIKNNGSRTFDNMSLIEDLPSGLEPLDTNLSWNFSLGPYEQKSISYKIKPQKPGTYTLLPGSSRIEYQGIMESNTKPAKLIVNGPYVIILKSVNTDNLLKGGSANVTVEVKNIGDATAIVKLNDSAPAGYFLSNSLDEYKPIFNTIVLHPGSTASFSYTLNTTIAAGSFAGSFDLPPAKATVFDQYLYQDERYVQRISSNNITINVSEPLKPEPYSVKTNLTPVQTVASENIETPVTTGIPVASSTPKTTAGFQGYSLIMLFIVIWVVKKQSERR